MGRKQYLSSEELAVVFAWVKLYYHSGRSYEQISRWARFYRSEVCNYVSEGKVEYSDTSNFMQRYLNFMPKRGTVWVKPSLDFFKQMVQPLIDTCSFSEIDNAFECVLKKRGKKSLWF